MPDLDKYRHLSRFDDIPIIYASSIVAEENVAKASLDNLKNLIPDWKVDFEKNIDLLGIAFNAAVVNLANKNGDVMDTQTALEVTRSFEAKFLNKEHKRDKIIGHILSAGFSSYGESNILYPMDIAETKDPFNIALGAVVYKIVDKEYAAKIEASTNSQSSNFQTLSASWEVGMVDYKIAMGSPNLKDAEIISDAKYIEELKKHLKAYGGSGKYNNSPIYRLIGRECIALGCAITERPAADVSGLLGYKKPEVPEPENVRATFFGSFFKNSDKSQNSRVIPINPEINMELETILKEVKASLAEISASKLKEEAKANLVADISDKLLKANEEYVAKTNEAKAAKEKAEAELTALKATQEAQATELAATKQKLADLEAKANAEASANLFSARMEEMNNEFDLDDEDRAVLASEIKNLDEKPESFAAWKDKMGKLMKDKNKKGKEAKEKEAKAALEQAIAAKLKELSTASANKNLTEAELAKKALEEATAKEKQEIPNNNSAQSELETLRSKWKAALSKDSVTITQ